MNKDQPKLHFTKNNLNFIHFLIALIPLFIYGFYKNSILPFLNNDITFMASLRPWLFILLGGLVGYGSDFIFQKKSSSQSNITSNFLYSLLISMTIPWNMNIFLYLILLFTILILFHFLKKIKISPLFFGIAFFKLWNQGLNISYANASEIQNNIVYSMLDIFFGRNIGGIFETSIFWCMVSFLYLSFNFYYKKEIPLYIIGSYIALTLGFELITPSGDFLKCILNSSLFFGSIFIASETKYSPYLEKSKTAYGILIGVLSFFLIRYYNEQSGFYVAVLVISLLTPLLDYLAMKIKEKKHNFCRLSKNEK